MKLPRHELNIDQFLNEVEDALNIDACHIFIDADQSYSSSFEMMSLMMCIELYSLKDSDNFEKFWN